MQDSTDPGSARSDGIQEGGAGHELEIQGSEVRGLLMLWRQKGLGPQRSGLDQ